VALAGGRVRDERAPGARDAHVPRWPEHERAAGVRETAARLEAMAREILADAAVTGDDALEVGALHEEAQVLMEGGRLAEARATAQELLRRRPDFAPAYNNLSLIEMLGGDTDAAIATARRVLELDAQNFHALGNLTRFHVMRGEFDEAREYAARLRAARSENPDIYVKKAEALSYLGDDAGVLDALREAQEAEAEGRLNALLWHLAAVALMRQGREDEAKQYWQRALEAAPGFEPAQANLSDLGRPVGERHAPWPFHLSEWVPRSLIEDLVKQTGSVSARKEAAMERAGRRFLELHPAVTKLIPVLLERGDPVGREFAVRVSVLAKTPELLAALRDFALGQHGPDALRMQAAQPLLEAGLMTGGMTRFWLKGEWQDLLLLGIELHGEPLLKLPRQAERLLHQALDALRDGDGVKAEALVRQALELAPDVPALYNNLAKAYEAQGRRAEAEETIRQIHERFPDYLFGRANLAQLLTRDGHLDAAEELLKPLFARRRMHFSEFAVFAVAQIELALARRERRAARSWFEMWEEADPDNPLLDHFRARVSRAKLKDLITGFRH
jgi:tetratricopeptide (TPR) repeat protein